MLRSAEITSLKENMIEFSRIQRHIADCKAEESKTGKNPGNPAVEFPEVENGKYKTTNYFGEFSSETDNDEFESR